MIDIYTNKLHSPLSANSAPDCHRTNDYQKMYKQAVQCKTSMHWHSQW